MGAPLLLSMNIFTFSPRLKCYNCIYTVYTVSEGVSRETTGTVLCAFFSSALSCKTSLIGCFLGGSLLSSVPGADEAVDLLLLASTEYRVPYRVGLPLDGRLRFSALHLNFQYVPRHWEDHLCRSRENACCILQGRQLLLLQLLQAERSAASWKSP